MSQFENGKRFNIAIRSEAHRTLGMPYVIVDLATFTGEYIPVIGKVDTGASQTMLPYSTARKIGIGDPSASLHHGEVETATEQKVPYHEHLVCVRAQDASGAAIHFYVDAGFAREFKDNFFGIDWLRHVCLAFDSDAVYFLKD